MAALIGDITPAGVLSLGPQHGAKSCASVGGTIVT